MRRNALIVVLGLNVVLAAILIFLWSDADRSRWSEPEALPPSFEDVAVSPASEPTDISRYRETLERPLFASSRRIAPRREEGNEGREAVDPLKGVVLLGTYGAPGRGGVMILSGGKVQRVPIGASIGNWKVAGQKGRVVELVRANGERRKLELVLNATAPAMPSAASKADASEPSAAVVAPAGPVRAAAASPPGPTPRAAEPTNMEELRAAQLRKRIENINARRAKRGLPPITQ